MDAGFTKGPWTWTFIGNSEMLVTEQGGSKVVLCGKRTGGGLQTRDANTGLLVSVSFDNPNARLIAAAPDLYEALKRAEFRVRFVMDVGEPHEYSEWVELHDQIEAALLKASGETK